MGSAPARLAVVTFTFTCSRLVPSSEILDGSTAQVAPRGAPLQASVRFPARPFTGRIASE